MVLVASTSEVYGKSSAVPFREDQDLQLGLALREYGIEVDVYEQADNLREVGAAVARRSHVRRTAS